MAKLVTETKTKKYNGESAPRIVIVSPIAFENIGNPDVTDGTVQNVNLAKYTAALKQVAADRDVVFADIFTPTKALFEESSDQLTLNGAHLNDAGYQALAPILMEALGGTPTTEPPSAALKAEVADKNFHWWHRYRAVNGYSIYGKRGLAGETGDKKFNNRDVMERERAILDEMTANRDARIWAIAQGQKVSEKCDDSNTLPFLEVVTNVGGENDRNRQSRQAGVAGLPSCCRTTETVQAGGWL